MLVGSLNKYFNNGPGNRGFLDVHDTQNNIIYDSNLVRILKWVNHKLINI